MTQEVINKIKELRDNNNSYSEICKKLNLNKSVVAYYCNEKRNKEIINHFNEMEKQREEYERLVCDTITQCNNWNQVCTMLNKRCNTTTLGLLKSIALKHNQDYSHFDSRNIKECSIRKYTLEEIFCKDSEYKTSSRLSKILIKNNLRERRCDGCGKTEAIYKGKVYPIPLQAHHINGEHSDNRLENIELLCPTCHSLTDNFAGKNIKFEKKVKKCPRCGKEFYLEGRKYCSDECMNMAIKEQYEKISKCPSRDELIDGYRQFGSFVKIGNKYGVTDVTVRKWYIKYNLPIKVKEIRKFIIDKYGYQPQWYEYRDKRDMSQTIDKIGRKVNIYTYENGFIKTCLSIKEAAVFTGLNPKTIVRNCNGSKINNKIYYFKFKE